MNKINQFVSFPLKVITFVLLGTFTFAVLHTGAQSANINYCPVLTQSAWMGNPYNNRNEVRELQTFLFKYYDLENEVTPTGYFGKVTKNYLSQFQREFGLRPITGGLGPLTRNKIASICAGGGGTTFCTADYTPVCGQTLHECCRDGNKPNYCTYAKVSCEVGNPKTFSNQCELNKAGAKYLYSGECRQDITYEAPASCKVWYDGCNTCSRSTIGGPLMCTLMACIQGPSPSNPPYCKEYFTGSTQAPVIKSFSGPSQLRANQSGTWTILAEIFNNQQLTYNITWGDERYDMKMAPSVLSSISAVVPQTTTFEHTYMSPGTYTVTIEVRAQNGQSTKTTSTVYVTYY